MAETGILTSQYVRIELPVASVADRLLAQLVDWLVLVAYSTAVIWLMLETHIDTPWTVVLFWLAPIAFYSLFCEVFFHGQSLGKMALKTRVVMADGSVPTLSAYLLRWLLWLVDGPTMSFLGLLVMVLTRDNQRLGDLAAGTVVVKQHDYHKIQVSLDDYDYLKRDYSPRYPAAADLSLEQIEIIRRTLTTPTADQTQRTALLADKVKHKLGITPQEPSPAQFLQRIERDYQYYALEEV